MVERFNQILEAMLANVVDKDQLGHQTDMSIDLMYGKNTETGGADNYVPSSTWRNYKTG